MERWKLKNLREISGGGAKTVWSAESEVFGPVILKRDVCGQLESEMRMLSGLAGKGCCRVWAYDPEAHLLLEERILPGTPLWEEEMPENRVRALAEIVRLIHRTETEGQTYQQWLENICQYCKSHPVSPELCRKAEQARIICAELFGKYPERMLLHGDLHHGNILRRGDTGWVMIDPKGVVGPPILDLPRFLLNETAFDEGTEHMDRMLALVGRELGYPVEDLEKALFMEAVLATVWFVEDGIPVQERILALTESRPGRVM